MTSDGLDIQRNWDFTALQARWPASADTRFVYDRLSEVPVEVTARGASGRVLEVGGGGGPFLQAQPAGARERRPGAVTGDDRRRPPQYRSPFCAVRSGEVLSTARERLQVVHQGFTSALFPLAFSIDVEALAREAPDVLARVFAAETEALIDPTLRPCEAYVVFRR
jgi:hypothetical protein